MKHSVIQYLKRNEIDDNRWNDCIEKSINGTIYCTTKYLDTMANVSWGAVVAGNYEVVLALPYKIKYGISYIYSPAFTQQMGIVFLSEIDANMEQKMLNAIPKRFRFININLNARNKIHQNIFLRKNFILDLSLPYENLKKNYSRLAKRNIAKGDLNSIQITENISTEQVLNMHRFRFNDNIGVIKNDYKNFLLMMEWLCNRGMGFCFGAMNCKNDIIASSFYAFYKNRLYFIMNGNLKESLDIGATHKLKDYVIQKFSNQNIILDFEGSDNLNFARFYKQFGAVEESYARLIVNRLPWLLKILKK